MTLEKAVESQNSRAGSDATTPRSESVASDTGDSAISGVDTVVEAKYFLGCDGTHSWLRKQLGIRLERQSSGYHWVSWISFPSQTSVVHPDFLELQKDSAGLLRYSGYTQKMHS